MTSTTTAQIAAESDADREQRVLAGKQQPAPKRQSRTSRAAAKAASDSKPKSTSTPKPAAPKQSKPAEVTKTDKQRALFAALMRAAGDLVEHPPADVAAVVPDRAERAAILRQRQQYVPSAAAIWDARLGEPPSK